MKQEPKRARGRPPMNARKYLVRLTDEHAEKARKLGGGKLAAGVRKALELAKSP